MSRKQQSHHQHFRRWTALFFVLVMAGFGFVQAIHVHEVLAGQSSPASHCSLCVVAHSAAVATPTSAAPAPIVESALLATCEPQLESRLRVVSCFIRPPPANL
jgi:hypothetical protein